MRATTTRATTMSATTRATTTKRTDAQSVADRDGEIVAWLAKVGAAGAEHVGRRFGMGRSLSYIRLAAMTADGLLEHRKVLHGWPGMYSVTREGLRWQGLSWLHPFRPTAAGFEHAWRVAATAVALHLELPCWRQLAEREIGRRQAEREEVFAWARVGGNGFQAAYHRPDLALISPSGRVTAVEVELSEKDPRRLERICRAWTRARHVERIYYLATPAAAKAVRRAIEAVQGEEAIVVLGLEDTAGVACLEREQERGE